MTHHHAALQPSLHDDLAKLSSLIATAHDLARSGVMIDLANLQKDVASLKEKFSHLQGLDRDNALLRGKIIELIKDLDALATSFQSSE